jgi:phage gp36-like protein
MPYATPADLIARYDARDVGQLCSDDKTAVSTQDLVNNYICLTALNDASGDIDGALMVGNRYNAVDLATLTANSTYKLARVTCDLAMRYLIDRRPGWNPEKAKAIRELAEEHLERLRKGENTFNIQASMDAGEPVVDGPTMMDFVTGPNALNLMRDRARNFYPPRWLPRGRN